MNYWNKNSVELKISLVKVKHTLKKKPKVNDDPLRFTIYFMDKSFVVVF